MKKRYETPTVDKMVFDYTTVILTSGGNGDVGHGVGGGGGCDGEPGHGNPKTAHPVYGGC